MHTPEELLRQNENLPRQERLLEISRTLGASLELDPFLSTILSAASDLTGCELASILAPDENGRQLHFLAAPWFHRDKLKGVEVPVEASIAGKAFTNGRTVIVPDVSSEPRHCKDVDRATGFVTRWLIAVPIRFRDETLGVLEVVNKIGSANYTEDDLTILETLASQAAVVMKNHALLARITKADEAVQQLDRMKSDFIAIASHELRTPLGLVLGHATYLREMVPQEYHYQLDIIVRNSMRLKDIIDSIADMDNAQRGLASVHRQPVSMQRIIEDVLDTFKEEAGRRQVELRAECCPDELRFDGDGAKITIALANLVKNALTFTNPGGHVLISLEKITGHIKVAVSDDGLGIPPSDLGRIFERFYQVESHLTRTHGGMGLGLSIARTMIELHGGRIWAESVEGQGSQFTFILPSESGPLRAPARASSVS